MNAILPRVEVGKRVDIARRVRRGREQEDVGSLAARQRVMAEAAVEGVAATAAPDAVIARAPAEADADVSRDGDLVLFGRSFQALDARQDIALRFAASEYDLDHAAGQAADLEPQGRVEIDDVLAGAPVDRVTAGAADDRVVAGKAEDLIIAGEAAQRVVAGRAFNRVVVARAEQSLDADQRILAFADGPAVLEPMR